jgi:hypothetical protein
VDVVGARVVAAQPLPVRERSGHQVTWRFTPPNSPRSGFWHLQPPYAAAVQALLENGPMQGKAVEVEPVEGRPPKTIDVPDEKGGTCRYCLAQWTQEGMTAVYTFLYAV